MALSLTENIKKRKVIPKTEDQKLIKKVRQRLPKHIVEIELVVENNAVYKLTKTNEHLRLIRNTVLGKVYKNYEQMIRTKRYKKVHKIYKLVNEKIEKTEDKKLLKTLTKQKEEIKNQFKELRKEFNVTFEYVRKYGEMLRIEYFSNPDSVCVLSICENVWGSMEKLMFGDAKKVRFYKKGTPVSFQGKQATRCIILKRDKKEQSFFVSFMGMRMPLKFKKNDLFIEETLGNIQYYIENEKEIEKENISRFLEEKPLLHTYRILNNRIVTKEIRGKKRFYLQIVLEGSAVPKRKRDGSFRHQLGTGRIGCDLGTQSVAIVSEKCVLLKNLAERNSNSFHIEHKIVLLQRKQERSRRLLNPTFYDEKGRIKKGPKKWIISNRYKKRALLLRDMQRKASTNRQLAHNEDINFIRSLGDEFIVEEMNIKALQKKAKEATKNEKTGKWNRRKRFGKSIARRSPGYFLQQTKYKFESTGGLYKEVNTWTFKASQYDHKLNDANKKQLSQRWHCFTDGVKVQRDLYSAFLLYCTKEDLSEPDQKRCLENFEAFLEMHNSCIEQIKKDRKVILNSGIKIKK